jgi:hypothetical protein
MSPYTEMTMPTKLKFAAIAAALVAGTSGAAMAQYSCPAGYTYSGGVCQRAPSGPLSGAAAGGASGAAAGNAAAGPVGAVVGGALGTATGAVTGTANALTGGARATPTCAAGYVYYNGGCHPQR